MFSAEPATWSEKGRQTWAWSSSSTLEQGLSQGAKYSITALSKWCHFVNVCCSEAVESCGQIAARGAEPPGQRGGIGPGRGARHQVCPLSFHLRRGRGTGHSAAGRRQPYNTEEHVQQATRRRSQSSLLQGLFNEDQINRPVAHTGRV